MDGQRLDGLLIVGVRLLIPCSIGCARPSNGGDAGGSLFNAIFFCLIGSERKKTMNVLCPTCSVRMSIPDSAAGRKVRCPKCNAVFIGEPPVQRQTVPPSPPLLPSPIEAIAKIGLQAGIPCRMDQEGVDANLLCNYGDQTVFISHHKDPNFGDNVVSFMAVCHSVEEQAFSLLLNSGLGRILLLLNAQTHYAAFCVHESDGQLHLMMKSSQLLDTMQADEFRVSCQRVATYSNLYRSVILKAIQGGR